MLGGKTLFTSRRGGSFEGGGAREDGVRFLDGVRRDIEVKWKGGKHGGGRRSRARGR